MFQSTNTWDTQSIYFHGVLGKRVVEDLVL